MNPLAIAEPPSTAGFVKPEFPALTVSPAIPFTARTVPASGARSRRGGLVLIGLEQTHTRPERVVPDAWETCALEPLASACAIAASAASTAVGGGIQLRLLVAVVKRRKQLTDSHLFTNGYVDALHLPGDREVDVLEIPRLQHTGCGGEDGEAAILGCRESRTRLRLREILNDAGPNATIARTTITPPAIRSLRSNVCLFISTYLPLPHLDAPPATRFRRCAQMAIHTPNELLQGRARNQPIIHHRLRSHSQSRSVNPSHPCRSAPPPMTRPSAQPIVCR